MCRCTCETFTCILRDGSRWMPINASTEPVHPTSKFGYVEHDRLEQVVVASVEHWLQDEDSKGARPPPWMFCYASRCFLKADEFSPEQRSKAIGRSRYSLRRPPGLSAEKWEALARKHKKEKLNYMDPLNLRNRAFAVYMWRNTRLVLTDNDGNSITSEHVSKSRKRKECVSPPCHVCTSARLVVSCACM